MFKFCSECMYRCDLDLTEDVNRPGLHSHVSQRSALTKVWLQVLHEALSISGSCVLFLCPGVSGPQTLPSPPGVSAFAPGGFSSPVPAVALTSMQSPAPPLSLSGPAPLSTVLSAPPMGPPTTGFSVSAGYDITRGHAGRTPQTPLMPSFSSTSPMPGLNR